MLNESERYRVTANGLYTGNSSKNNLKSYVNSVAISHIRISMKFKFEMIKFGLNCHVMHIKSFLSMNTIFLWALYHYAGNSSKNNLKNISEYPWKFKSGIIKFALNCHVMHIKNFLSVKGNFVCALCGCRDNLCARLQSWALFAEISGAETQLS